MASIPYTDSLEARDVKAFQGESLWPVGDGVRDLKRLSLYSLSEDGSKRLSVGP